MHAYSSSFLTYSLCSPSWPQPHRDPSSSIFSCWNKRNVAHLDHVYSFFSFFGSFGDRVSLCQQLCCPGAHFEYQADLKLTDPAVSDSQALGLKECTATARLHVCFLSLPIFLLLYMSVSEGMRFPLTAVYTY